MTTRILRVVGALVVLVTLAAGCGSGRSSSPADDGSSPSTTAASGAEGTFGDLESPCGPLEGDANVATGDQGVTADEITIGYGDDAGYQGQPGLNQEMSDAVEAMIEWCNDQGGINGRTVVGKYYDAKILEASNAMQEACTQVFMLVGQGWALDNAAEQIRLGCDLPMVPGYTGSSAAAMAPLMVQPVPNPIDELMIQQAHALAENFPEAVTKTATVYPSTLPSATEATLKVKATYPEAGFTFLECDQNYQIGGEADWKPFAQRLKDCGAEAVYFAGAEGNMQNLLDASKQLGFEPIWFTEANFYTDTFAKWNSSGNADRVYVKDIYVPLENPPAGSATAQYLQIVQDAGGRTSQLGAQATSAFLLWASAAQQCGAELTRDCVMQGLYGVTEWTGGGLHAATNPGQNQVGTCGNVLKMDGTEWVQWQPEGEQFQCDPSFRAKVDPPLAAQGALMLDADRKAQQYNG